MRMTRAIATLIVLAALTTSCAINTSGPCPGLRRLRNTSAQLTPNVLDEARTHLTDAESPREGLFTRYFLTLFPPITRGWIDAWSGELDRSDQARPVPDMTVDRTKGGFGALTFFTLLVGPVWADSYRYAPANTLAEPVKQGTIRGFLPLYIDGRGVFPVGEKTITLETGGVPLVYAYARGEDEDGRPFRMSEVLSFNIWTSYWIDTEEGAYWLDAVGPIGLLWLQTDGAQRREGWYHMAGWGSLWLSRVNRVDGDAVHGPLWGMFGWGKVDHRPVARLFWRSFPIGKRVNETTRMAARPPSAPAAAPGA